MSARSEQATCDRREFIRRFMQEGGLTYSQSCKMYEVMCRTVADAVVTGSKITLGRVGAIVPCWRPAREVQMHFRRKGSKIEKGVHRTFFMDGRYDFKFKLHRRFAETNQMKWLLDMPVGS